VSLCPAVVERLEMFSEWYLRPGLLGDRAHVKRGGVVRVLLGDLTGVFSAFCTALRIIGRANRRVFVTLKE